MAILVLTLTSASVGLVHAAEANLPQVCAGVRPDLAFECVNGTWTTSASLVIDKLIVTSHIVIGGNASITSFAFQGLGTSLTILGCFKATTSTEITVAISKSELVHIEKRKRLDLVLVDVRGDNCNTGDFPPIVICQYDRSRECVPKRVVVAQRTVEGRLETSMTIGKKFCHTTTVIISTLFGAAVLACVGFVISLPLCFRRVDMD